MEPVEREIVRIAKDLAEALRDVAYTRKEDDKKRVSSLQMELVNLCLTKTK